MGPHPSDELKVAGSGQKEQSRVDHSSGSPLRTCDSGSLWETRRVGI